MDKVTLDRLIRDYPAKLKDGGVIITGPARLSFPALDKPRKMEGSDGEPKYQASLLFPASADLSIIKAEITRVVREKWGDNRPGNLKLCLKKQDDKAEWEGYAAGAWYTSGSSLKRPGLVGPDMQPVGPDVFYGGCWVRASIRVFAYDVKVNKGVGCGLNNLQFLGDDQQFGGATKASDDFDAIPGLSVSATAALNGGAKPSAGDADMFN